MTFQAWICWARAKRGLSTASRERSHTTVTMMTSSSCNNRTGTTKVKAIMDLTVKVAMVDSKISETFPLFLDSSTIMSDRLLVLVHDGFEVTSADHLFIEQLLRSIEKRGLSFCQQPFHALVLLIDDTAHFAVDLSGSLLRVVAFLLRRLDLHHDGLAFTIECDGPQLVAHSVGLDHALGDICRLDQVILRPRGSLAENQFFGNPPSKQDGNFVLQLRLGHQEAILRRELKGIAQRGNPAGNDRDLLYRV